MEVTSLEQMAKEIASPPDPTIKPEITVSHKDVEFFQHRSFGERTLPDTNHYMFPHPNRDLHLLAVG